MQQKKNISLGIIKILVLFILTITIANSQENENNKGDILVEINILDKVSSKTTILTFNIGEEKKFQNLLIKVLKCENSKFDDDPEITAYIQVKDLNISNKNTDYTF